MRITKSIAVISLVLFAATAFLAARAKVSSVQTSSKAPGPPLDETISFMNRSVAPEDGSVTSVNKCELYILRNGSDSFALPDSTYLKSTDRFGVPHYGFKWTIIQAPPRVIRFSLTNIDPSSINSKAVPSLRFIKEHDLDKHPEELKQPDLTVVNFQTANSERSIEEGHFKDAEVGQTASPVFDRHTAAEFLIFKSKDRAERFVTAFIHAVNLCGGKVSEFQPTPSKP